MEESVIRTSLTQYVQRSNSYLAHDIDSKVNSCYTSNLVALQLPYRNLNKIRLKNLLDLLKTSTNNPVKDGRM